MLSVPGVIAGERTPKKFDRIISKSAKALSILLPFLNLRVIDEKGDTSSDQTSDDGSAPKIKVTGGKLVNKVVGNK